MGAAAAGLPDEGDPEKYPMVRRPTVVQKQGGRRCSLGGVGGGSEGGKDDRSNKKNEPLHDLWMAQWVIFVNFRGNSKVGRKNQEKQLFLYYY